MSERDSPFHSELEEAIFKPKRELVDQPRDEVLKLLVQAPAPKPIVQELPKAAFRDFDKKVKIHTQSLENDEQVYAASNGSVDVVEVIWSTTFDASGFSSDFGFAPAHFGSVRLEPKTKTPQPFLKRTRTRASATPPKTTFKFSIGDSKAAHKLEHPYALPLGGDPRVSQGFNTSRTHSDDLNRFAIDFEAKIGTDVVAARGGLVVAFDDRNPDNPASETVDVKSLTPEEAEKLSGNYVLIRHEDFTYGLYLHLKFKGAKVKLGSAVTEGQSIGTSGNSGTTSGPHLHFAVLIPNGRGPFESVEFKFKDKQGKPVRPQESKRPSEWVVDELPPDRGDTPLIQDDL